MKWKVTKEDAEIHRIPLANEKRRYRRMRMILGIVCKRQGKPSVNIFTDDVSPGGLRFTSHDLLEKGEEVTVVLPIGHGVFKEVKGVVAWIRHGVIHKYEGGIRFDSMDEDTVRQWEKFIERNAEKD